jgi:hypothetical protein
MTTAMEKKRRGYAMGVVSKRLSSGLQAIGAGVEERATRAGAALRTFRNCYSEAIRQARLVDNNRHAQKHYRKLYLAGDLPVTSTTSKDYGVQEYPVPAAGPERTTD